MDRWGCHLGCRGPWRLSGAHAPHPAPAHQRDRHLAGHIHQHLGGSYYNVRAIDGILPADEDWKEALSGQMYPH